MLNHRWLSGVIVLSLLPFFSIAAEQARTETPADVRILVDISGSMKETDPSNLRIPAVNLLVELLPDNARAGVWTFGRQVNMLVPLAPVDKAWRQSAKEKAKAINSVGLYTNLPEALSRASWKVAADSGYKHSLILLTDGRIDMREPGTGADINEKERNRLLKEVLPVYIKAGARIHTLALSDGADHELLQQIALETGGLYLRADTADDLLKAFLKAFDRSVPAEQVPIQDNRFTIDSSVKEFTALIFRRAGAKPTRLIAPDGVTYQYDKTAEHKNIRWHRDVNFDLITLDTPVAGEWKADADIDPDNSVRILSDLNLRVRGLPDMLFAGTPVEIDMALTEKAQVISEAAILRLTDITLKVTAPDGRSGSKVLSDPENLPADGIYRESMTRLSQVGEYQFEITATGRTFQRRQLITSVMQEPLRVESLESPEEQLLIVSVIPEKSIDTALSRIMARITHPDGSSVIQNMEFTQNRKRWELQIRADKGPGEYEVSLNIRGVTAGGADVRPKPDDIKVKFPLEKKVESVSVAESTGNESSAAASEAVVERPDEPADPAPGTEPAVEGEATEAAEAPPPLMDLQAKFAEQEALAAETDENASDGMPWWIYVLLGVGNLLVFGGAATWWLLRKRKASAEPEPASARAVPDDLIRQELSDEDFSGDFDAFEGEAEEEVPMPSSVQTPDSMGSDADMTSGLDDDFAIDPEPEAEKDDWGEFDTDSSADAEPKKPE